MRNSTEDWAAGEERAGRLACAICDGMGGMRHGDRAARAVADRFLTLCLHDERSLSAAWPPSSQRVQLELAVVMARLQAELRERRVATTFTGLALTGLRGRLYHVGDSRAYLLRGGGARQLSRDHRVSADQPQLLSQALGSPQHDRLECLDLELEPGDRLLLCSDGFTQTGLESADLPRLLAADEADARVPELLLEEALRRGAEDNLSLVWIIPEAAA
ncbi:MAG: PP2C family serine/threonine-protein phosphatase [Candidatus Delongbacteria bacterium]